MKQLQLALLSLNSLYDEYQAGELRRTEIEVLIYRYLVNNQDKTCLSHWKRDEYEDYLSWFYPRIQKTIDSYQDIGASFEAFMAKILLISSKEYRVRITSDSITEYSVWSAQVPDMYTMYVQEKPPVYSSNNIEKTISGLIISKKNRKNTRRVLALILKYYYYISEDFAERIAPKLGIKKKELLEMLKKIRTIRQKRDDKIYYMQERTQTQFLRCLIYEKKLSLVEYKETLYNKWKLRLEKARVRLEKMRKRMKSIRTEATNKQIAEIIGISKGTVDASLHRLKVKWGEMSKKANLN